MTRAPKFYTEARKQEIRNPEAFARNREALADDLKALSASIRSKRAKAKAAEQSATESPDEGEREAES